MLRSFVASLAALRTSVVMRASIEAVLGLPGASLGTCKRDVSLGRA